MAGLAALVRGFGTGYMQVDGMQRQRDKDAYDARVRQHNVKLMDQAEEMLPVEAATKKLRAEIEQGDLEFQRLTRPKEQQLRQGKLDNDIALQPTTNETARIEAGTKQAEAQSAAALQPGAATIAAEGQDAALRTLGEQQAARLWQLVKLGDKTGAVDLLSKSRALYPGREFKDLVVGSVASRGPDGQPQEGPDGRPVVKQFLQLVPKDGKDPEYVPAEALDALVTKYGSKVEKVGHDLVRIDGAGNVTPVYQPDEYSSSRSGVVYSKRTGKPSAYAAEFGVSGNAGVGSARTALEKNVDFLVRIGVAKNHSEAFTTLRTASGKPENQAILSLARDLMRQTSYMSRDGQQRAVQDATQLVRSLRQQPAGAPAAAQPASRPPLDSFFQK